MNATLRRPAFLACLALSTAVSVTTAGTVDDRFFREKVEPVLASKCYQCHSGQAKSVKAGLRLDTREGMLEGGDSGPAVVPGKSAESLIVQAVRHEEGMAMPPKSPRLDDSIIADLAAWVDAGAPDPRQSTASAAQNDPRRHWAFQPVRPVAPPAVKDTAWPKNPVDAFVLANLEERGWKPSPEASRADWIRRVTFDLTGLPPTPEEIAGFEADRSALAYETVVDRLLASTHYGERWAQHWLDVIRYAESEGYEYDRHVPDAWRFRDYVVDALNHDKPFDRFVLEQLAGDEVGPNDPECLTASAFHRLGPVRRNAGDAEIALSRNEVLTERTDVIGAAFLGLTVGCARCHNHKLEPIAQKDYYRLQAYLAATDEHNVPLANPDQVASWEATTKRIKAEMEALKTRARRLSGKERIALSTQIEALEDSLPPTPSTIPATWNSSKDRTEIHVLKRGEWAKKGEKVGPRPLGVLVSEETPELPADVPDPRTRLARWLTEPSHPLTPRVIANRLWQHHFGIGIVKTVNDFGTKGDRPSHPELLDWLARSLVDNGWRLKPLHRAIVLSSTYRQSSRLAVSPEVAAADPENRLLSHFGRRRLSAEEVRDAMLAASGRLNRKAHGPSVMLPVEPELVALLYKPTQWQVTHDLSEHDRRSVYLISKRNLRLPFLEAFDAPAALTSCARRESSTHAPQALELLNGRISNDLAASFAARLRRECGGSAEKTVDRAFALALGRSPTADERRLSLDFLAVPGQPLEEFALAVFNLNGFLYVP